MTVEAWTPGLVGLLLGVVRAAAWLFVAPPFASRTVPSAVKGVLAFALALPVAPRLAEQAPALTVPALLSAAVLQALTGAALGFLTYLMFAAVQAAGDLIDLFGGFTLAFGYDPLSMANTSVFGRLHQLLAVTLLFATNAHLLVLRGFLTSYDALPVDSGVDLDRLGSAVVTGLGEFFLAGLQIAAPLVGVLVVADVGLGLLTKVSPALNAFSVGFPAKIGLTLLLVGLTFPLLPRAVESVAEAGTRAVLTVVGG